MRKIPLVTEDGPELELTPFLGAVYDSMLHLRRKYIYVHKETQGHAFLRYTDTTFTLRDLSSSVRYMVWRAQNCTGKSAVFEFSSEQELKEWLEAPVDDFCPLCAQTPRGCLE